MNLIKFKADGDERLSEAILARFNGAMSYSLVMKLIRQKDVKINGERTNKDVTVAKGDEISVYTTAYDNRAENILFEDENILAAVKPKGITSEDFYDLIKKTRPTAFLVHRLDRNTDGIMLFALNPIANDELLKGFKNRSFKKYYLARVYGTFAKKEATLEAYLLKDEKKSEVKIFDEPKKGAVKIITRYEVLSEDGETSLLNVELVTGKTHQIRAHLAHAGHPLIGDGKYGYKSINDRFKEKTQSLTAYKTELGFGKESPLFYLNGKTFTLPNPKKYTQGKTNPKTEDERTYAKT